MATVFSSWQVLANSPVRHYRRCSVFARLIHENERMITLNYSVAVFPLRLS